MKKIRRLAMILAVMMMVVTLGNAKEVEAASKYIKVEEFATELVKAMGLTSLGKASDVNKLVELEIIKDGDFKKYTSNLTRGDALMLLSRADDYLNKPEIDEWLVETVIEKRISDIKDADFSKREDIAKGYIKGFIKGYYNGDYITNREMRVNKRITRKGALNCIKMINDESLRAKISPDGQLIRTTKLPRNADKFDYILASFPNEFYERQFEFMLYDKYKDPKYDRYYAYPVEMKNETFRNWYDEWPLIEEMDKYLYDWQALAEEYLNYLFNVDYRTVDDKWIEGLGAVYTRSNLNKADMIREYYIPDMKENRVIVESDIIAVEPSTFYKDSKYCMRAYVRYKITANDVNVDHAKLIYSAYYPWLNDLQSGEWREGIFDIRFGTNNGSSGDGAYFTIDLSTDINDDNSVPYK